MRSEILTYQQEQHQQLKLTPAQIEIIAGADETFFPGFPRIIGSIPFGQIQGEGRYLIRDVHSRIKLPLSISTTQAGIIER